MKVRSFEIPIVSIACVVLAILFGPAIVANLGPSLLTVWIPLLVRLAFDNILVTFSVLGVLFGLIGLFSVKGHKQQAKEVDLEPTKEEIQEEVVKAFAEHTNELNEKKLHPELFEIVEPEIVVIEPVENAKAKLERLKKQILEGKSE